jgi:hypothetical protein
MPIVTRTHHQPPRSRRHFLADQTGTTTNGKSRHGSMQLLTLVLDGITAADYLAWVRDPDPAALGRSLRQLNVRAQPLGDRVEVQLVWEDEPPAAPTAAVAAGFPLTQNVAELLCQPHGRPARARGPRTMHAAMRSARIAAAAAPATDEGEH